MLPHLPQMLQYGNSTELRYDCNRTFTYSIFQGYEIMVRYIFEGMEYEKSYRTVVTPWLLYNSHFC